MLDENLHSENDALLLPFLVAETEEDSQICLNQLFIEQINPQINKVLASYLTLFPKEKEEITSDAQTRILGKLRALRESFVLKNNSVKPIENLPAYMSTITFNCRKDFILAKQPEWRRTENRLFRLKDEETNIWHYFSDEADHKFFALNDNHSQQNQIESEEIVSVIREIHPNHLFLKTQDIVPIILETANGFLAKNDLIRIILEVTESTQIEEVEMPEEIDRFLHKNDEEYFVSKRQKNYLHRIWEEINTFPPHLRKVLILSLKESRKVEAVTLLLKKRIATIAEIAQALEVSLEEFSEIFARLPMSSKEIAEFLNMNDEGRTSKEQRVDNLRRIARDLLRKRLEIKK